MGETWSRPELYRKMCEPFESEDEFTEATNKFNTGLRALREECGIQEVVCVFQCSVTRGNEELAATGSIRLGCEALHDVMLAKELGFLRTHRIAILERLQNGEVD